MKSVATIVNASGVVAGAAPEVVDCLSQERESRKYRARAPNPSDRPMPHPNIITPLPLHLQHTISPPLWL
jgi:hypothetical protein